MFRNGRLAGVVAAIALLLVGCGNATVGSPAQQAANVAQESSSAPQGNASILQQRSTEGTVYPLTVTDGLGRAVQIAHPPQTIVSLAPSNTEILYALGLGDRVAGVDAFSDYPPQAKQKPKVGDMNPNIEAIVSLHPDLVIGFSPSQRTAAEKLQQAHIPTLLYNPQTIDQVFQEITQIGQVAGIPSRADRVVQQLRQRLNAVQQRVSTLGSTQRVRVLILTDTKERYTGGKGTLYDEVIQRAGGINTAASGNGWYALSKEQLLIQNPHVIVLTGGSASDLQNDPSLASVVAVKERRIVTSIDPNLLSRAGPRLIDGVELLAKTLYPNLFPR
ncbi:MAG: ABC transporter substrate-binding protein [Firmicutes bacterium]|nr:ABC transporter substrate-binding protein [Bacillota bacterium]